MQRLKQRHGCRVNNLKRHGLFACAVPWEGCSDDVKKRHRALEGMQYKGCRANHLKRHGVFSCTAPWEECSDDVKQERNRSLEGVHHNFFRANHIKGMAYMHLQRLGRGAVTM